uniref:NADH-ubiquinone oxidoreductase chain 5 n=1 Tax=Owenia fusiformis TaxID=6347 RepID=A0A0S2N0D5_OWEFU|nr:NADH dehydrogenase subunit 5 [Owenia fusiformis]ALO81693.1 NADH dehydrogenase subunit 5 [Owenia fusiformis]
MIFMGMWFVWKEVVVFFEWELFNMLGSMVTLSIVFDKVGVLFSLLVLLISSCVFMFSSSYMSEELYLSRFSMLVLLFVISMCLLIFIPNMISLLIGWDGLGLVSFLLVIYYQSFYSLSAGLLTVMINRVGDVMLLLSIGWCVNQGHWFALSYYSFGYDSWVCLAVLVAGMTKSAQIPFSSWLPAAMAAPTPVSALVHSSTLVTAGIFLIVRFYNFLSEFDWFLPLTLLIGVSTMFMAGLGANVEMDLKKVIALSTLSQLGVMMASVGVGLVNLALFHLFTHALFKALLFLCAGNFIHLGGHYQDMRYFGQMSLITPLTSSCMNVANLALCGFPFMAGFYSKDAIMESYTSDLFNWFMWGIFFISAGLTASYSLRMSYNSMWGNWNGGGYSSKGDDDVMMTYPMMVLLFGAIVAGASFSWGVFSFETTIVFPVLVKVIIFFLVFGGFWLGYILSSGVIYENEGLSSNKKYDEEGYKGIMLWGVVKMWYLVDLNAQPGLMFTMNIGKNVLKSVDFGWAEVIGGQGV